MNSQTLGIFFALVLAAVAGCATETRNTASQKPDRCDEAYSKATGFGAGQARAVAVNSARGQTTEVRGYLVSQGFRHIRPVANTVTCGPSALGSGLTDCTAVTRYCGR